MANDAIIFNQEPVSVAVPILNAVTDKKGQYVRLIMQSRGEGKNGPKLYIYDHRLRTIKEFREYERARQQLDQSRLGTHYIEHALALPAHVVVKAIRERKELALAPFVVHFYLVYPVSPSDRENRNCALFSVINLPAKEYLYPVFVYDKALWKFGSQSFDANKAVSNLAVAALTSEDHRLVIECQRGPQKRITLGSTIS